MSYKVVIKLVIVITVALFFITACQKNNEVTKPVRLETLASPLSTNQREQTTTQVITNSKQNTRIEINQEEITMVTKSDTITITYRIGLPYSEGGQTTLHITNYGTAVVENQYADEEMRRFEGSLKTSDVTLIQDMIDRADLWQQVMRDTAIPDEAPVEIKIERSSTVINSINLWEGQFQESNALQMLKETLDNHIREISKGEVF